MQVILLVVVGAINQSKYVPMMSLAVVRTLTNHILLVYTVLRRGLHGSTQGSTRVYVGLCGLCRSIQIYAGVYVGLHRSMLGSMRVYTGVYMGLQGSMQRPYAGLHGGFSKRWWGKNQDFMLIRLFNAERAYNPILV